jgi:antitoxin component YwqK of YwqJK toxin-antitoxin module
MLTEHVIENSVFDNYNAGKIKISANFKDGELMVTALHSVPKNVSINRSLNYRQGGSSWEEQIDLLNRLKQLNIRKWVKRRTLAKGEDDIVKLTLTIPSIDHYESNK